jgi:hypothetical protein
LRQQAEKLAQMKVNGRGGGLGIQLGDLGDGLFLGGVDLDSCIDESGCLAPWAEPFLAALDTYACPGTRRPRADCRRAGRTSSLGSM